MESRRGVHPFLSDTGSGIRSEHKKGDSSGTHPLLTALRKGGALLPSDISSRSTDKKGKSSGYPPTNRLFRKLWYSIFGREDDKERIIEMIQSDDFRRRHVSFLRVVGATGLGKTTLVFLIYAHPSVCEYFDTMGWVLLSAERCDHMGLLLRAIIECFTGVSCGGLTDLDQLREILEEELTGKRFLLVLDGACNEDPNFWSDLLPPLSTGAKGSVVVVTTQVEMVANFEGLNHSYQLNPLEDHICWSIIKDEAFLDGDLLNINPNLEIIGKKMAAECKGLPLLAKAQAQTLWDLRGINRREALIHFKSSTSTPAALH